MAKFHALLSLRLKPKDSQKPKMTALAERSTSGDLSSFSGIFRVTSLQEEEKRKLENLLKNFRQEESYDVSPDLDSLIQITSEVRAITNQAVILHGERIKKAQTILKAYQEGAFTAWLIATYGNRQTPYNFLQYYEFYILMPTQLHPKIDEMPRQAIYTLASRSGDLEKKEEIVRTYNREPKQELLEKIRKIFPLAEEDERRPNYAEQALRSLSKFKKYLAEPYFKPSLLQKRQLQKLLKEILQEVEKFP